MLVLKATQRTISIALMFTKPAMSKTRVGTMESMKGTGLRRSNFRDRGVFAVKHKHRSQHLKGGGNIRFSAILSSL
jgi:hypothetical protein